MVICASSESFVAELTARGRLIGLDVGTKTIGIAVSDESRLIATPQSTLKRIKFTQDAEILCRLFDTEQACGIVIGLPLHTTQGDYTAMAQSVTQFARNLSRKTNLPILLWDERLSTQAARRALEDSGTRAMHHKAKIDHIAAGFILQGVLDALKILTPDGK
ncbi:MAG: Holliday junction resolvase RuvX [Hyphomicrobiales bacterium]|nr:Holliday junction resolvase RuvX [Rickettsiales bacterium]MCP5362009.1 Holliday junction resolvase RuvX [Hyphomicrobiales bacterium]